MIKRTMVIVFAFILGSEYCSGQKLYKNDIKGMTLEFSYSLGAPDNHITIEIRNTGKPITMKVKSVPISDHEKWKSFEKDTTMILSNEQYDKLQIQARKLKEIDVAKASIRGLDGTNCSLQIGRGNSITYDFWTPNLETSRRGLENFVQLFRDILQLADFDYKMII